MGGEIPKQYLPLLGTRVLEQTLSRLLDHPCIEAIYLALAPDDAWWPQSPLAADARIRRVAGGVERCHSVRNALAALSEQAAPNDWVLVHDAARPCLRQADLDLLLRTLAEHQVGGLLAQRVRDTMKEADANNLVLSSPRRDGLWHAFTPQMFRLGPLIRALDAALAAGHLVTDEASAMEYMGHRPLLVEGHDDNIKITRPGDLALAAFYLEQQQCA
jgi:2-C-methyl-D-erythritol 4-phosphate cytidylyltransferase